MKEVETAEKLRDKLLEIDKATGKNLAPLFVMLSGAEVITTGHVINTLTAFTAVLQEVGALSNEEVDNILG